MGGGTDNRTSISASVLFSMSAKSGGTKAPLAPPLPSPLIGVQGAIHQPIENLLTTNIIKSGLESVTPQKSFRHSSTILKVFFDLHYLFLLFFSLREKGKN